MTKEKKFLHTKVKEYTSDFVLNILAAFISTGTMQLVLYPQLSRNLSSADYGLMLTATGFVNVLISAFGCNLCYSRLLQQAKYEKKGIVGDYSIMLLGISIISFVIVIIANSFYLKVDFIKIVCPLFLVVLTGIWKSYFLVTYRITNSYGKNFIASTMEGIGYCLGGFILIKYVEWPWAFLPAYVLELVYIYFSSNICREGFNKTVLFKDSAKVSLTLLSGGLIGNLTTYLDRFIIYPILGSEGVSVYSTACWFAKSLVLIVPSIMSVLLNYITTGRLKINKKRYYFISLVLVIFVFLGWFICLLFAPFITKFMYPTLVDSAKPYIAYASLSISIGILGSFLSIIVFAYADVKWQTIIPIVRVVIYFILGVILVKQYGIMGMIVTVFVASSVCNIIYFILGIKNVRENR